MKILKLEIQNFLTIGHAYLELNDRGLLLIQGDNRDDPSAESNGAGKSSVVDALCWALYGVTARGVTGDAVVNKTAKKECAVAVLLEDAGVEYRVCRHRKHTAGKNTLVVSQYSPATGGIVTDLSKGTDKETQAVVDAVVGCSLDVFMAAVYAGQEKMPDLPGMTDKVLKTLIEEAAGVEVLTAAYGVARDRANKAKVSYDVLNENRAKTAAQEVNLKAEVVSMETDAQEFNEGRRDRAKAELAAVLPINKEIEVLQAGLAPLNEATLRAELAECQEKVAAHKTRQSELEALQKDHAVQEREVTRLKATLLADKRRVDEMESDLANIESKVGTPCGSCGKTYREEDLTAARTAQQQAIAAAKEALRIKAAALRTAIELSAVALQKAEKYREGIPDITVVANRQQGLTETLNHLDELKRGIETKRKEIETVKARANAKFTEPNPWTKAVEIKKEELARTEALLVELTARAGKAEAELELLNDAVRVFGPAGVRAHVLDTVTPYLNDRTRDYLGALTDGNIHATWTTLQKTAKGELREKFGIEVTNDKGAESFAGLSGGEKRKVRLATAMALQDMVASRATKPIGIFVGDEIDHALDESGLERLMGVLERKAKERGTVLVISHNSLSDWIDSVITVTKSGGLASVSGATAHGY